MLNIQEQRFVAKYKKDIRFEICAYVERRVKHMPIRQIKASQKLMDDIEGETEILGEKIKYKDLPNIMVEKYLLLSKKQYVTHYNDLISEFSSAISKKTEEESNVLYNQYQEKIKEEKEEILNDISFLLESMKIVPKILREQNKNKKARENKMINAKEVKQKIYKDHAEGKITLEQREEAIIALNEKLVQEAEEMDAKKMEKEVTEEIDKSTEDAGDTTTESEGNLVDGDLVLENFFTTPMIEWTERLRDIKNAKPTEYSDNKEIKKFADKHADDIVKASKLLEKDVSNMKKENIIWLSSVITGLVGSLVLCSIPALTFAGLGAYVITCVATCVTSVLNFAKCAKNDDCAKELMKIKQSLKKVQGKKGLDKKTQTKIAKMIGSIEDAEAEYITRTKTEESVDLTPEEKYISIISAVYEKEEAGEITEEERKKVLDLAATKYMI